jgi:IstB-like ATP binding protein
MRALLPPRIPGAATTRPWLPLAACPRGLSRAGTPRQAVVQPLQPAAPRHPLQPKLQPSLNAAWCVLAAGGSLPRERREAHDLFPCRGRRYARGRGRVPRHNAGSAWAAWLGDAVLAAARLDRRLHHAAGLPRHGPASRLTDRRTLGRADRMARPA